MAIEEAQEDQNQVNELGGEEGQLLGEANQAAGADDNHSQNRSGSDEDEGGTVFQDPDDFEQFMMQSYVEILTRRREAQAARENTQGQQQNQPHPVNTDNGDRQHQNQTPQREEEGQQTENSEEHLQTPPQIIRAREEEEEDTANQAENNNRPGRFNLHELMENRIDFLQILFRRRREEIERRNEFYKLQKQSWEKVEPLLNPGPRNTENLKNKMNLHLLPESLNRIETTLKDSAKCIRNDYFLHMLYVEVDDAEATSLHHLELDLRTLEVTIHSIDPEDRLKCSETFSNHYFKRTAFSADKRSAVTFLSTGGSTNKSVGMIQYDLIKNTFIHHDFTDLKVYGVSMFLEPDIDNNNFQRDSILVEIYENHFRMPGLSFFRYHLKRKKFDKVFQIPDSRPGYRLQHSYGKIDRRALHGREDCLVVLRFCYRGRFTEAIEYDYVCDLFYVNLCTKLLLFRCQIVLEEAERHYRAEIHQKFLWNSKRKFVMRFGQSSLLVVHRAERSAKVYRHTEDVHKYPLLVAVFDLRMKAKIEERFQPRDAFFYFEFEDLCALYSRCCISRFKFNEFRSLENFVLLNELHPDRDHPERKKMFVQFPFRLNRDK